MITLTLQSVAGAGLEKAAQKQRLQQVSSVARFIADHEIVISTLTTHSLPCSLRPALLCFLPKLTCALLSNRAFLQVYWQLELSTEVRQSASRTPAATLQTTHEDARLPHLPHVHLALGPGAVLCPRALRSTTLVPWE